MAVWDDLIHKKN